ncbi:MAG: plastocyanin/azurin family copper-binding protein, partial [Planctomycetota bacterium]
PAGFKTGRGNAYESTLRDHRHGRIYRLVYDESTPAKSLKLSKAKPAVLLSALSNDNMFWRLQAQRLLVERGKRDVIPQLVHKTRDRSVDSLGLNSGVVHALWTLHGLDALDGSAPAASAAALDALRHPSAGVRRNAIQVLANSAESTFAVLGAGLLHDRDAHVRLAAFLKLADCPPSTTAAAAILAGLHRPNNANDRWIPDAATSAAATNDQSFLVAWLSASSASGHGAHDHTAHKLMGIVKRVATHYAQRGDQKDFDALASLLSSESAPAMKRQLLLSTFGETWAGDAPQLSAKNLDALRALAKKDESTLNALTALSKRWKRDDLVAVAPSTKDATKKVGPSAKARVVNLGTKTGVMKYDKATLKAKAGERIKIVFKNSDFMIHNLLILESGSLDKVGALVDKMATDPTAAARLYLPDTDDVLHSTKLVQPGQTVELEFTVPSKPGKYPYICTFPGHWRLMQGTLVVE